MSFIEYHSTDIRDIELIRDLWNHLNDYHHSKATAFRSWYEQTTFDDRKAYFKKVANTGTLRLDLAFDPQAHGRYIGYIVSSLTPEKTGEIESIFVMESYRSRGVGSALVKRTLAWLDENGSVRNRVSVGDGNEEAWVFYKKFGFYPRMTVLEQKRGNGED